MATLTLDPTYPVPKTTVRVTFTPTGVGANFVRVWVTDAPTGSTYRKQLDKAATNQLMVFESSIPVWETGVFDVGGTYVLSVQEYQKGGTNSYGGRYEGDPNTAISETPIGAASTLSVYIGQRVTCSLGFGADKAKLVLWCWNDTVRATSTAVHGELSPAIINPSSSRALAALNDTAVKSMLSQLDGGTISVLVGTPASIISDLVTKYEAHRIQGGVHSANDGANVISAGYKEAPSPSTYSQILTEIARKLRQHMLNDVGSAAVSPTQPGVNSGVFHGSAKVDWTNLPAVQAVGQLSEVFPVLGDLIRAYDAHRTSAIHNSSDTTNTLDTTSHGKLVFLHRYFSAALAALTPTVPATKSSVAVLLQSQAGFVEEAN